MPTERINDLKKAFKEFYNSLDKKRLEILTSSILQEAKDASLKVIDDLESSVMEIETICMKRGRY